MPTADPSVAAVSMQDLKVDDHFNFVSTHDVQLNVSAGTPLFAQERFRVNVYDGSPDTGNLLASGMTDTSQKLSLALRIPAPMTELYVEKINAFGASVVTKVTANDNMTVDFNVASAPKGGRLAASQAPDCQTGATKVLTNYNGWLDVNRGDVISLTGSFSGGLNMNGGTVRICGKASLESISMNGSDTKVYFLSGAEITLNNLNMNAGSAQVYNYTRDLTIRNGLSLGGSFENNGTVLVNGDLNLNNNGTNTFVNNGSLTVASNLNNNRSLENTGSLVVKGSFQANGGSTTINSCKLLVGNDLTLNSTCTNTAYISVAGQLTINGSGTLNLQNGALITAKNALINNTITASGATKSTVRVASQTTFNGSSSLSGPLNYCDANGVETNNSKVASSFFNCDNYIPVSDCNPEGFGKPVIVDTDQDGVADSQDAYPNDPTRATASSYPSTTSWATYGFEDNWPDIGDYDFNDLVLNFRDTRVFNAKNQVVELRLDLLVQAVGAGFINGLGIQLDGLTPNEVTTVSGQMLTKGLVKLNANKTEAGQSKAVIIAYDSPEPLIHRTTGPFFNVVKADPKGEPGKLSLVITFKTPIDAGRLKQEGLNPFIFVNGTRGREVHLINFAATDAATPALFGTRNDTSKPGSGRWYKSTKNLPWALEIPNQFDYPIERASATDAYRHFGQWVQSAGSQYTDWYQGKTGYQNLDKVYTK